MKRILMILLTALLLTFAACSADNVEEEQNDSVYFTGAIVELNEGNAIIEPDEGEDIRSSADKISIYLGEDYSSYKIGDKLKIEHTGIVMESYPAQIVVVSIEKIED